MEFGFYQQKRLVDKKKWDSERTEEIRSIKSYNVGQKKEKKQQAV